MVTLHYIGLHKKNQFSFSLKFFIIQYKKIEEAEEVLNSFLFPFIVKSFYISFSHYYWYVSRYRNKGGAQLFVISLRLLSSWKDLLIKKNHKMVLMYLEKL